MSGVRFFSGSRDPGKQSIAREILKLEMEKGGKLSSQERFRLIMDKKLKASKQTVKQENGGRKMSLKAERALKEIAAKKASKEAKRLRHMVIVEKKIFSNGMVQRNGKVMDVAGNVVANINKKNGKMTTNNGTSLGDYKPKNSRVQAALMDAINKHSPYFINLRKMQAMQAAGIDPATGRPIDENTINVHGNSASAMLGGNYQSHAGEMFMQKHGESPNHFAQGPDMFFDGIDGAKSVTGTAWGARSNNVWGTMGDNVWGTAGDNVWGSQNADIWGGIGFNNPYGKTQNIWGTGNGKNYLKVVGNLIRKMFGRANSKTVNAFKQARQGGGSTRTSSGPRGGAPTRGPSAGGGGRR